MRRKAFVSLIFLTLIVILFGCSNYNRPPFKPIAVYPKNKDKEVPFDLTLSWKGGDPDGDAVTYEVYFGKSELEFLAETTLTTLTVHLSSYGTYKWKVVAKDPYGRISESDTWTFSTKDPPRPSTSEVIVVGEDEIKVVDVSNPLNPTLEKVVSMPGVTSVYFDKEGAYAAGCSWVSKLDKNTLHEVWKENTPGCAEDVTTNKYVFLSMEEDGLEYLDPLSPDSSSILDEYSKGLDSSFDKVYVAAGAGGIYEVDTSTLKVSTITIDKWILDVKWSGNALYFISGSGVGRTNGDFYNLENLKSFDVNEYKVYALSGEILHILDFSEYPTEMSSITLEGAKDVKVVGDYIYAVGDKFYAVDVSNPRKPIITGVNESIKGLRFAQN